MKDYSKLLIMFFLQELSLYYDLNIDIQQLTLRFITADMRCEIYLL